MIFVVGFGAFFWFLVIRPAAASTEIDVIKNALSQAYIALDCLLLLMLGVLLLAGAGSPSGRRVPLLAVGRFRHHVSRRHVLVGGEDQRRLPARRASGRVVCCVLRADGSGGARANARAASVPQRGHPNSSRAVTALRSDAHRLLVLVSFTRGDIGSPATRDDHGRFRAHVARDGAAGAGSARRRVDARAPRRAHGRGRATPR